MNDERRPAIWETYFGSMTLRLFLGSDRRHRSQILPGMCYLVQSVLGAEFLLFLDFEPWSAGAKKQFDWNEDDIGIWSKLWIWEKTTSWPICNIYCTRNSSLFAWSWLGRLQVLLRDCIGVITRGTHPVLKSSKPLRSIYVVSTVCIYPISLATVRSTQNLKSSKASWMHFRLACNITFHPIMSSHSDWWLDRHKTLDSSYRRDPIKWGIHDSLNSERILALR